MQVNFTNNIISNRSVNNSKYKVPVLHPIFRGGTSSDAFVKDKNPFSKMKYFTIDEYMQLSEDEIEEINEYINGRYDESFDTALMYHEVAAEGIRQTLDHLVGAGKYVFIPIGRSVSSIGKCLSYKIGDDNVKLLPMSEASRFLDLEKCEEDFEVFCRYLDSIGLSKNEIENSGKMYIFTDYCRTGKSLSGAKNLIQSDKIFGKQNNVAIVNVLDLLTNIQPGKINEDMASVDNFEFRDRLEDMFSDGAFNQYSLVDRCTDLSNTVQAVKKPEDYGKKAKCFLFALLDDEMNKQTIDF